MVCGKNYGAWIYTIKLTIDLILINHQRIENLTRLDEYDK